MTTMKLSDHLPEETEIIRDGNFSSLGTLYSSNPSQVVYITRGDDVNKVRSNRTISCVITTPSLATDLPPHLGVAVARDPRQAFYHLQAALNKNPEFSLPSFTSRISSSAKIHPSATISPRNVDIGQDVVIEKNVRICEHSVIDEGSVIRSNSIIGEMPVISPELGQTITPSGGVHLHRETDIHANIVINRAVFHGYTEIGEQTKIDNLSVIGQGTVIGDRCLLCGGVSLGEFVKIGDDGWIGPNAIIADQVFIGKNVYITIGSRVTRDISDGMVAKDNFVLDRKRFSKVLRGM